MKNKKYAGKIGKFYFKYGNAAGCYNIFRRQGNVWKYWKSFGITDFKRFRKENGCKDKWTLDG